MSISKHQPQIAHNVFIAKNATVIGNCVLHSNSSVWFGAVLRGDNDLIEIGAGSNIQDLAVIHVDPEKPVKIGEGCTIGHRAIVHGAKIGNNVLVGMGAIIMNNCVIGNNCIIGAGALLTEGTQVPDNSMVLGMPAKVVKTLTDDAIANIKINALSYIENAKRFMALKNKAKKKPRKT